MPPPAYCGGVLITRIGYTPTFVVHFLNRVGDRAPQRLIGPLLGIFARLNRRDGKPQYLRHMPRIWRYLQCSLDHPALQPLKDWYGANVPARNDSSGD